MKRLLTILLLGLCLVSCNRHSEHWATITAMERIIEERPDSVLNVLQAIDTDELVGDEEPAKHALLLSMALDKNVIDKTDFEVLQPAIDYYKDNGTATDKLRNYYYQGRIYQNAGNDAAAMTSYVNALDKGAESNDKLTKARTLVAQSTIYYSLMKWDKVYDVSIEAANYYFELGRINNYILSLLRCIGGCLQNNNYDKAKELLDKCYQHIGNLPESIVSEIYSYNLLCLSYLDNADAVHQVINEYKEHVADNKIDYLVIAGAYTDIRAYNEAESTLQKIDVSTFKDEYRVLKYYTTLLRIYEHKRDFNSAYEVYKKFNELNDSIVLSIFESDTQFVEERHNLEMAKAKETEAKNKRTIAVLACVVALIGSLLVIMIIRRRLQISHAKNRELEVEKQKYEQLYADAIAERDALTKMVEDSSVREEAKAVIKARLDVLNKVIISQITGTTSANKKAYEELELLLADKETFIESTRLTIEGNNPEFITALKRRGLTDEEINICCLYAIGLKGKDIKAYTSQPRHYNQSADIRHKLGLTESDTNLSIFIRDMLEK